MSINIGDLLGKLGGGGGGGSSGGGGGLESMLLPAVMGFLTSGGLPKLLNGIQSAGLGDKLASWTGSGSNEKLSPDEVKVVLSDDDLAKIAQQANCSKEEAAGGLGSVLPAIFDTVTPGGQQSDEKGLLDMIGGLAKQLG